MVDSDAGFGDTRSMFTRRKEGYFGSKSALGVVRTLVNHVPPHDALIIPFAGHCALSRTIQPCRALMLYDIDGDVFDWWKTRLPDHAEFGCVDGLSLMATVADYRDEVLWSTPERTVFYCDPPYRLCTRTSSKRYRHDWTDDDHARFLQVATRLAAMGYRMLISHYRNEMYDAALRKGHRTDFTGQTRGGPRTESLYYNFEITALHDYRFYCGESSKQTSPRRQREVMKRREQSARRKIEAMAPLERKRFLRSLVDEFGDGS